MGEVRRCWNNVHGGWSRAGDGARGKAAEEVVWAIMEGADMVESKV